MIESIEFQNFKILRDTMLPLGRCTILVGPNASGKSTVLQALEAARSRRDVQPFQSVGLKGRPDIGVRVKLNFAAPFEGWAFETIRGGWQFFRGSGNSLEIERAIASFRVYALDARAVARPAQVAPHPELGSDGAGLAAVLDHLRDSEPERFERLSAEFCRWLPEFADIRFERPKEGHKAIALRLRDSPVRIPAADLSQGTLLALAILALAHLPEPPSLVGLQEPDRGLHPRLLRHVRDAIYRLAYPENFGEDRKPVQVIATTHSPYFLDQFCDHPEEVVIAHRIGDNVRFERLSHRADIEEILGEAPLGEVWHTGDLGGVPSEP